MESDGHLQTCDTDYRRVNGLDCTLLERRHEGRAEPAISCSRAQLSKTPNQAGKVLVIVPVTATKEVEV